MPTISDKELERYKRIEEEAQWTIRHPQEGYPAYQVRSLEKALKPVSNRPTLDELRLAFVCNKMTDGNYRPGTTAVAIKVLEALRDETIGERPLYKVLEQWIEEYKAER